ncbi:hypothetical protein RHMOL_Rhmol08G0173700 [Rhododendron molle]|uniref:Uncharacterized protein n=1 Tax=Rhododendron molle TaxID=49168 RepID=A0ACC0MPF8_RHOML|nr:hypothetical protein RHMOL_Rhmol08G0173700 [Rhododendron molle]
MADHDVSEGGGEVVDRSEDRGSSMAVEETNLTAAEPIWVEGAEVVNGSDGVQGREQEPGDKGSEGAGGSGTDGGDTGSSQTPPRDSTKGKWAVIEEEETIARPVTYREADVAFWPAATTATSLSHLPITFDDIAEHTPGEILAKLLEDHPAIGEYVLKAKEDRARAIEAFEAAARAERERARPGGLAADVEAEERDAEEAQGPRVSAVTEAGAMTCLEFSEETYTPPRPHLFVPLGFAGYRPPQQTDYDAELVLRDPRVHIANTWAAAKQRDIRSFGGACSSLALGSTVHLLYLPALRDLRTASRFDWAEQRLAWPTCSLVIPRGLGRAQSATDLWAYEVLRMYPPECKHPDLSTLPRALIWSKEHRGTKEERGSLNAYRLYLDELRASQIEWNPWRTNGPEPEYLARRRTVTASRVLLESAFGWQWYLGDRVTRQSLGYLEFQVPGPLPPRASHTSEYTLAELERFTRPDTELTHHLRPTMDYAAYQRNHLARPLGVRARREVQEQAREAGAERRAAAKIQREGKCRVRRRESRPVVGGPPELLWKVDVVDSQGNPAEVQLTPARIEPAAVMVQVPAEWVNEAVCRMLALENVVRRAASGFQLELRYLAPPAQPAQAAASRRTQPAAASKEAARKAVACTEERYRIEMRNRSGQDEPARKKQLILSQPAEEEEEGGKEEEGEEEEARSGSDNTVDDPNYL